jgi:hypothetical protein
LRVTAKKIVYRRLGINLRALPRVPEALETRGLATKDREAAGRRPAIYEASAVRVIGQPLAWALMSGFFVADLLWSAHIGLSVDGWWGTIGTVCVLLLLSVGARTCSQRFADGLGRRCSRSFADMAEVTALWSAFTAVGCVLTYLCATLAQPLQDAALNEIDHAIGFDWLTWREAALTGPIMHWVLRRTYMSLMPQILFFCVFFPAVGLTKRGAELLLLAASTLLPTLLISAIYPALGPIAWFGGDNASYLPDLLALRAGGPWHFNLPAMQGIITMPSYHTTLAVLFIYACRGTGPVMWLSVGLNGLMLLSIPPVGGHYLVDVLGGGVIALLFVLGSRWVANWRRGFDADWASNAVPIHTQVNLP